VFEQIGKGNRQHKFAHALDYTPEALERRSRITPY
jgi:hypothetical protein